MRFDKPLIPHRVRRTLSASPGFFQLPVGLMGLCLLVGVAQAEDVQNDHGLQVMDERGCVLGNASMQAPTLTLMAAAYGESEARKDMALAQMTQALDAGCPVDEPDQMGLSALNGAILYGEPALVTLLLEHGADPRRKIVSPKTTLNGLDSFAFLAMLTQRDGKRDRTAIRALLEKKR
ncbi:hypothetical protein [Phytopseudomonas seleniipraecipitans]|uniref:Uncharacterized protein n=1 Tax=Phytopseudomonas seleniipraecipitans TaxID=640205 RepID=A0A1G7GMP1_9GAMM|nr:hypothetical protein [Pseudomonas seleniipraecipitans]SDE89259.1 hypothetical protein SAMN05216381_0254 [Pseudomonas seleniipraecipitans]